MSEGKEQIQAHFQGNFFAFYSKYLPGAKKIGGQEYVDGGLVSPPPNTSWMRKPMHKGLATQVTRANGSRRRMRRSFNAAIQTKRMATRAVPCLSAG